ncbi:ACP phosphodiesterase [Celerinatantimonas sp. MCCC 1A17872]|uniref:acyl carrier protein phosphodiesterase n=1 Tax=Celerinatantimonas sp. MCCC 1A17872 TaxID=3177514 RepID=UPI0038CAD4FE
MNYLGHFYLAHLTHTSYQGALLGDFVRGKRWQDYQSAEQLGILLHRTLDGWIDQWTIDSGINALFNAALRRFAPIALDLYWDYQLASRWSEFEAIPLQQFAEHVYHSLKPQAMPTRAQETAQNMTEHNWLGHYQQPDFILRALKRISERMNHKLPYQALSEALWAQELKLRQQFDQLMRMIPILAPQWQEKIAQTKL